MVFQPFNAYPPIGQITSLKFALQDKLLLFGAGPFFCQVKVDMDATVTSTNNHYLKVFDDHTRIHKIQSITPSCNNYGDESLYLLSGGKRVSLLSSTYNAATGLLEFTILLGARFNDWIRDVKLVSYGGSADSSRHAALLFSQNFVQLWNLDTNELVDTIKCQQTCMLYSGTIVGESWEDLQFASGTIFNQVLLWSSKARDKSTGEGLVERKLIGHEGVLFGIEFNESRTMCLTMSDDRSIRIWDLLHESQDSQIVLKGHEGRVWGARFAMEDTAVVSISEDSSCRLWDLSTKSCVACWDGHGGKHVWSFDVCKTSNIVATGGGDGGIRVWCLDDLNRKNRSSLDDMLVLPIAKDEKVLTLLSLTHLN